MSARLISSGLGSSLWNVALLSHFLTSNGLALQLEAECELLIFIFLVCSSKLLMTELCFTYHFNWLSIPVIYNSMVYWKLITALKCGILNYPCLCFADKSHCLGESDVHLSQHHVFSQNHRNFLCYDYFMYFPL